MEEIATKLWLNQNQSKPKLMNGRMKRKIEHGTGEIRDNKKREKVEKESN